MRATTPELTTQMASRRAMRSPGAYMTRFTSLATLTTKSYEHPRKYHTLGSQSRWACHATSPCMVGDSAAKIFSYRWIRRSRLAWIMYLREREGGREGGGGGESAAVAVLGSSRSSSSSSSSRHARAELLAQVLREVGLDHHDVELVEGLLEDVFVFVDQTHHTHELADEVREDHGADDPGGGGAR